MRKYIELVISAYDDSDNDNQIFYISNNNRLVIKEIKESIEKERDALFEEITGFKPSQINGTRLLDIYVSTQRGEKVVKIIYESDISKYVELIHPYNYINYNQYLQLREEDDELWKTK